MRSISRLSELNIKRRRAIIEYLVRNDFSEKGFKEVEFNIEGAENRITISNDIPFYISFDLSYASDYKEDAYTWCYVDFFLKDTDVRIPDPLKRLFTRVIDHKNQRILWRHRLLVRIIDMDRAVDYIIETVDKLRTQLQEHMKS